MSKNKRKYVIAAFIVLVCIIGLGLYFYRRDQVQTAFPTPFGNNASVEDHDKVIPTPPADIDLPEPSPNAIDVTTMKHIGVLLLGYGGAGHDGGYLSDTIVLSYYDIPTNTIALIHIPRDVWVSIPVNTSMMQTKINAALAMGTKTTNYPTKDIPQDAIVRAAYLSKQAVSTVTGLSADYMIGVDFNNLPTAINSLGGIDVSVSPAFDDPWYPVRGRELELCGKTPEEVTALSATMSGFALEKQFPCRYERVQFPAGKNHMDGDMVLKYARSRHSTSDFSRGQRQMEIVMALKDKLISLKAIDKVPEFYKLLVKSIKTDISLSQTTALIPILSKLPQAKLVKINLDTTNVLTTSTSNQGAYILIPKSGMNQWQDTKLYIQNQLAQR